MANKNAFYPLVSYYPFSRIQLDILDLVDSVPRANRGFRYILLAIDVFSRFVIAVPIKTKTEKDVVSGITSVLQNIRGYGYLVSQIDSDNESSFLSSSFKKLMDELGITQNLSRVGDHHSLGIIDRFCRTLRDILKRYSIAYDTNNWIDVIEKIIENYNTRVHSTLKTSPLETLMSEKSDVLYKRLDDKRRIAENQYYNRENIGVGSKVRLKLRKGIFEKGSERRTRTVHTVERVDGIYYYVNDRENPYKKEELQVINDVNKRKESNQNEAASEREADRVRNRVNRRINKEGVEPEKDIVTDVNEKALRRYRKHRDMGFNILY